MKMVLCLQPLKCYKILYCDNTVLMVLLGLRKGPVWA